MYNFNFRIAMRLFIAALVWAVFSTSTAYGQLSGSYTIDGSKSASTTNYKTFEAAVSDLIKGTRTDGGTANGSGVSGAVTFKVASGTYNERVRITPISGTSGTKTITFVSDAGDSTKVILENTTLHDSGTVILHGADYITFQKMTIKKADSTAIFLDNTAKNNKFLNNVIKGKSIASTTTSGFQNQQYSTIASVGSNNDSNLFQSNRIVYGTNGLFFQTTSTGNQVVNNIIDSSGSSGAYVLNQVSFLMQGNTVNSGAFASSSGHYVSYGIRIENSSFKIIKNKFYATSLATVSRCITVFNGSASSQTIPRNLIANNFAWVSAGSTSSTGITIGGCADCDIVYNNVLMTSTPTASAAFYYYSGYTVTNNIIKNNNLVNMGNGYAMDNAGSYTITSDYNNLFTKGNYVGQVGSTKYATLSSWISGTKLDSHSVSVDPGYVSNMDLHVSSAAINGKGTPVTAVSDDIDGQTRSSSTPDIGADEFTPLALDAGVTSLVSPVKYCAGTKDVEVRLTNFGTDTLKKATINWTVNGVTQTAVNWTGTVTIGNVSSAVTLGSLSLSANTPYTLKIWTSSPNGGTDGKGTNDTLRVTINSALSGTYTIGGTSPDFATFNNAVDALTLRGVCSTTVFNVRNGTYNEQLIFPSFNNSASSTITFQSESGDSTKVILSLASSTSTGASNALLQLNGADYMTFKGMTFQRTGTNDIAPVIDVKGGATNNNFLNNRIISRKRTTLPVAGYGDLVYSTTDGDLKDTANTFRNNHLMYGTYAFNLSGTSTAHENSNVIEDNIIDSTFATAISAAYNDGIVIRNNTLRNVLATGTTSNTSYSGILVSNSNGTVRITRNKVMLPYGGMAGIQLSGNTGTSGSEGLVANNYVSMAGGSSTATPYGIYINSSPYQNVYFNSVNIYNANAGAAFNTNSSGNINLKNNIFANNGGGQAIIAGSSSLASSDYNDLYTSGSKLGTFGSTAAADLAAWRTASSLDAKSISVKPYFLSNTSYITYNPALHGKGIALSAVTNDIENKTRSSKPSIGAFEAKPLTNEAGITSITSPGTSICPGTNDVMVNLVNKGTDTLRTATINWSINGTAQTAYSFTGKIKPDSTASIKIGSNTFATGTTVIKVYSSKPNGSTTDSFPYNDTVSVSIVASVPTANAGSDQSICSGSSTSIGSTAVTGLTYSWTSNPSGFTSTSANPSVSPTATTTYTVTVKNANGCTSTDDVTVTVNSLPTATAGSDQTICSGSSVSIGSTAVTGLTYSWTSNPSGFTSSSANPSVSPTATTTYTVEVKNANGCISKDDITVTVNSLPTANAGSDQTLCNGGSVTIGSTAVTGNTYSWTSNPSGFTSSSANPSVSPSTTTTYTVEVKNSNGCVSTDDVTVTVSSLPTANAGSDQTICEGTIIQIGATAVTGETYSWTSNPSGFTSTDADPSVNPTTTTTYTVEVTNANGCVSKDEVTVTVNPLPTANAGTDMSICKGDSVQIGSTAVAGETYSWTSTPSGFTSTDANPMVHPTTTTTYMVDVTNANGCTSMDEIVITVNPLPTANAGADQTICAGASVTIGSTAVTGETYSWTSKNGFTSSNANPSITPTATDTYTLVVTNANGCTSTDEVMVTVNPLPTANAGADQVICSGATVQLGSAGVTGETYSWVSNPSGFTSTDAQPNVTPTATTTYTLVVKNANGCTSTDDVVITVNPTPTANAGADQTICAGTSVTIGTTGVTGETYSWTSKNGYTSSDANPSITPTATDTYTVMVMNASGCSSTDEVIVTVNPLPTANAGTDQTICAGASVTIGSAVVTGMTYSWTSTNGYTSTDANPIITPTATATYTLMVTNASGCTSTDDVLVTVNSLPTTAGFSGTHGAGLEYTFTATDATQGTYTWDFGDGGSANTATATHTYSAAGTYNVKLTVRNAAGCEIMHDSTLVAEVNGIANNGNKTNFSLDVYPNPFTATTTLAYSLALKSNVSISLMDVTGKKVAQLVNGSQISGEHTYSINASDLNLKAGIYFINVNVDGVSTTRKIVRVQ